MMGSTRNRPTTHMSRHVDILPQYTVYLASKTSVLDGFGDVSVDMIDGKIWGDTVADFPTFDIFADCHNLASAVRAGNDVFLLAVEGRKR